MAMKRGVFLTELNVSLRGDDCVWVLDSVLSYWSPLIGRVDVPAGFETDFASVPRLPVAYALFGNKAHREGVVHDALFRSDFRPDVGFSVANKVFLEAMECRGKPWYVRWPMYLAVCAFSYPFFHKRKISDRLGKG